MMNNIFMPPELQDKGPLAGLPYFSDPNQPPIYQVPGPFTPLPTPVPDPDPNLIGQSLPRPGGVRPDPRPFGPGTANAPVTPQPSPYGGGFFGQANPFFGGGFGGFNPFAALFGGGGFNPFFGGFRQPQVTGMFNTNFPRGFTNFFGPRPEASPVEPTQASYNPFGMLSRGFAGYR